MMTNDDLAEAIKATHEMALKVCPEECDATYGNSYSSRTKPSEHHKALLAHLTALLALQSARASE